MKLPRSIENILGWFESFLEDSFDVHEPRMIALLLLILLCFLGAGAYIIITQV